MGLFSAKSETRSLPLTSNDLMEILAPSSSTVTGVNVSETTAPKSTAVWRAVSLLAGVVASLPIKGYREGDAGVRLPLSVPLLRKPHPSFTKFELFEMIMVHLLLAGNFYAVKQRNGLGEVVALLPVAPSAVTPKLDNNGIKTYEVPGTDGSQKVVSQDVLMHIPGMGYDGIRGWSPIAMCRQALAVGMAAEEFSARFFSNGSHLGGIITAEGPITPEQASEAKAHWRDRVSGLAKAHEVAVLAHGFTYQGLGIPPEDAQLIESRQFSIQDVGRIYGVPSHMLNEASGSTSWGSGLSEQVRGLQVFTLGPWLTRIEERFTRDLLVGEEYVEFTRGGLLQSTTQERYETYKLAIEMKMMTVNEARALENMAPLEEAEAVTDGD